MSSEIADAVDALNASASAAGRVVALGTEPFGPKLSVERYRLHNGLGVLLLEDRAAPTLCYHTWYRVGSRHEVDGKTGIAHLFEHLMFNETESLEAGQFDRELEQLGAESNASTWMDWTQYTVSVPSGSWRRVVELEAERMQRLVLRDEPVASEKEVVANERRYRIDDDVEGALSERLWATAFQRHSYRWPTIGWMRDIASFTVADCREFYRRYYAPNNATLVIVGDFERRALLELVRELYGPAQPAELPSASTAPEPVQTGERRSEMENQTPTWKVCLGYKSPPLGHPDHQPLSVLSEVLFGGRSSRLVQLLMQDLELVSDVRGFVSPFFDPGLFEISANARDGVSSDELLAVIDRELSRVVSDGIDEDELVRARARIELSLLSGLSTNDGKASTIGFYETVLGKPSAAFERLEALEGLSVSRLNAVAREYLRDERRTVVTVRPREARVEAGVAE